MARFQVYRTRDGAALLLDCQADTVDTGTRLVVPLVPEHEIPSRIRGLHPIFVVAGERRVMATHMAMPVLDRDIRNPVMSLRHEADRIMQAIDYLLIGF